MMVWNIKTIPLIQPQFNEVRNARLLAKNRAERQLSLSSCCAQTKSVGSARIYQSLEHLACKVTNRGKAVIKHASMGLIAGAALGNVAAWSR